MSCSGRLWVSCVCLFRVLSLTRIMDFVGISFVRVMRFVVVLSALLAVRMLLISSMCVLVGMMFVCSLSMLLLHLSVHVVWRSGFGSPLCPCIVRKL